MSNTIWQPTLPKNAGPIYRAIADALEHDIAGGVLREGARLPTHRELAVTLGVTPLTITRAYSEAARRGLVDATVGRGTFVRTAASATTGVVSRAAKSEMLDLSKNVIDGSDLDLEPRALGDIRPLMRDAEYSPTEGLLRHRTAAAAWIRRSGVEVTPDQVVITPGAQQAIVAALAALCRPGDVLLAEEISYPRLASIAALLHLEIEPVKLDGDGAIPQSLERAAKRTGAKAFYAVPNFQNPTGSVMTEKRRREIAAVAAKHHLTILEDDVYGFLLQKTPTPLAQLLPSATIFITGISKSATPSLRLGFLSMPEDLVERVTSSFASITAFTSTVSAEIFTLLLESSAAERTVTAKRQLILENRRIVERALAGLTIQGHPLSPHVWIPLPKDCDSRELADRARGRGVAVSPAHAFAIDRHEVPNAIRISIGATRDARQLESALRTLAALIMNPSLGGTTVV